MDAVAHHNPTVNRSEITSNVDRYEQNRTKEVLDKFDNRLRHDGAKTTVQIGELAEDDPWKKLETTAYEYLQYIFDEFVKWFYCSNMTPPAKRLKFSNQSQPPTEANYEAQPDEADTIPTFRSDNSMSPPGDLNAGGGYAPANDAAQDDSTGSCVDDLRLGIPTDYFTLDNMPSPYQELTSANVYAPANDAAQDDSTGSCVDDLRLGIPTDYFTLDNMPSPYQELTSANVYAPANDAAQDDSTGSCVDDLRLGIPTDYFTLDNMPSPYQELTSANVYAPANDAAQDDSTGSCVDDLRLGIPTDYFTLNNML
ncbi:hypothetical protein ARSEF4850_001405 [Beauveria asiatica]